MLKEIVLHNSAGPEEYARNLRDCWGDYNVFHLREVGPRPDLRAFYETVISRAGRPAFFAEDVSRGGRERQRTGEQWMEVRYDPAIQDAYRHSSHAQPLHTDGSYIPDFPNASMLYCVNAAAEGGETTFLNGPDLVRALVQEDPTLLDELRRLPMVHARSGDRKRCPVITGEGTDIRISWNYYCVDLENDDGTVEVLRERFFKFLSASKIVRESLVPVSLAPGEAVVWKDDRVLHGRNAFKAFQKDGRFYWKCALEVVSDPVQSLEPTV